MNFSVSTIADRAGQLATPTCWASARAIWNLCPRPSATSPAYPWYDNIAFDPALVVAEEIRKYAGHAEARLLIDGQSSVQPITTIQRCRVLQGKRRKS